MIAAAPALRERPIARAHGPQHARTDRLHLLAREVCRLHGFEQSITGVLPQVPAVLVANHLSYVDVPLLLGLSPCVPIAKREIRSWPLIGAAAKSYGVLFVDRDDPWSGARVLRQAVRMLSDGISILGFPEGTTTDGHALLRFRRGLFGAARLAGVPVIPIALSYPDPSLHWIGDQWFLPHYLKTAMRPTTRADIRIGTPIHPYSAPSADELARLARGAITRMLRRIV